MKAFLAGAPLVFAQEGVNPGRIGLYVLSIPAPTSPATS
jgi:hypothetical protein